MQTLSDKSPKLPDRTLVLLVYWTLSEGDLGTVRLDNKYNPESHGPIGSHGICPKLSDRKNFRSDSIWKINCPSGQLGSIFVGQKSYWKSPIGHYISGRTVSKSDGARRNFRLHHFLRGAHRPHFHPSPKSLPRGRVPWSGLPCVRGQRASSLWGSHFAYMRP